MKMTKLKRILSLIVCIVLIAAMALFTIGCNGNNTNNEAENPASDVSESQAEGNTLGQGKTQFPFTVVDGEGKETAFQIKTDKTTVGEALQEVGLIAGEEGPYGLYVKTVNGITVDYDKDGKYWAFYIDGKLAPTGVDSTEIKEGSAYSFKVE